MSRSPVPFAAIACLFVACSTPFVGPSESGGSAGANAAGGLSAGGAPSPGDAGASGAHSGEPSAGADGEPAGAGGLPDSSAGSTFGGSSGLGGAIGVGGIGGAPLVFTSSKLIDDMEDGDSTLLDSNGDWYVFKDSSAGTIDPPYGGVFSMSVLSPPRQGSTRAVNVSVSNFSGWGAAFGFDFSYASQLRQAHDLAEYRAVRFWAQADTDTEVTLQVPDATTDSAGGKCAGAGATACNAHWSQAFPVTTQWSRVTVLFSDLKQRGSGLTAKNFDLHHVYSVFFVIPPKQSVSVWIDDLELAK